MARTSVIVAQYNPRDAEHLAVSLYAHFESVAVARNAEELRHAILKHRASAAVVDLEMLPVTELENLRSEFPQTAFVCTHRIADEAMWAAALGAGAVDCCLTSDVDAILSAARRHPDLAHPAA